jgi:hypothetical protein
LRSRARLGGHQLGLIIKLWYEAEGRERLFWRGCSHLLSWWTYM